MFIKTATMICSVRHGLRAPLLPCLGQLSLASPGVARSSTIPASAEVKAGMSALPGGRQHYVIPHGM